MANITTQNNIAYCIDILDTKTTGLILSRTSAPVNLQRASRVTGITVGGSQPTGTARYFAFNLAGAWGKINSSGNFQAFSENSATYEILEDFGNTSSELTSLTDIPCLAGQSFRIAIALSANDAQNAVPSASLAFTCFNDTQQLVTVEYSPLFELGQEAQIASFDISTSATNGGSVSVLAQARNSEGVLTGWVNPQNLQGLQAQSIQFKAEYQSTTPGTSTAKIDSASFIYSKGNAIIPGYHGGEIISKTLDWYIPIHSCRITVRHNELADSNIKAFVTFRDSPSFALKESLGVGTGARKTFALSHTNSINYDSFCLYFDGVRAFTDYELNTETGRVTCTAPSGATVSCDYSYNWDNEVWQELSLTSRVFMGEFYQSEYVLTTSSNNKSAAAVKLQLTQTTGRTTNEVLGTATGTAKTFRLSHVVNDGNISITANNATLSAKNYSLHDDAQYITITAASGQVLRASYDWLSASPKISQFSAVFSQ